jgi:hypothetical protein
VARVRLDKGGVGTIISVFWHIRKGGTLAREVTTIIRSDLSGETIPEAKAWRMELTPPDGRRAKIALDISEEEAQVFVSKGSEVPRRGRRPGTATGTRANANPAGNGRRRRRSSEDVKTDFPSKYTGHQHKKNES